MGRVFVDTNVLFPFSIMDLMLALTEDDLHGIVWTETLLAEWERVIVRTQRRSPKSAAAITAAIREFFPDGRIAEEDYAHLISEMPGQDDDDRHHMAAAIAGGANAIITCNRAHFPAGPLAERGVLVMDPDDYLCELIVEFPREVVRTVVRLAAEKRRPPLTPYDLADRFAKAGTPRFAARLAEHLDRARVNAERQPGSVGADDKARLVSASDVSAHLAANRPPACHGLTLTIPPHETVGIASHAAVINAVLVEMLTVWPQGTTLVLEYEDDAYLQALAYPPNILTEIGQLGPTQLQEAVRLGWIDPANFHARHHDFESQPVWETNPVREWTHPYDPPKEIAAFLSASVRMLLRQDPGCGYTIHLFNNLADVEND